MRRSQWDSSVSDPQQVLGNVLFPYHHLYPSHLSALMDPYLTSFSSSVQSQACVSLNPERWWLPSPRLEHGAHGAPCEDLSPQPWEQALSLSPPSKQPWDWFC